MIKNVTMMLLSIASVLSSVTNVSLFEKNDGYFKKIPNIKRTTDNNEGIDTGLYYATKPNEYGVSEVNNDYFVTNDNLQSYIESNQKLHSNVEIVTSRLRNNSQEEKTRIRNEIIEIIKSGRPAFVGGNWKYGKDIVGHAVVAYDYDETNDILYGNFGWGRGSNHKNIDAQFTEQISDYWTLKILPSLPKERTDHYVFTDKSAYYSPGYNSIYHYIPKEKPPVAQDAYYMQELSSPMTFDDIDEPITVNSLRCGYIMHQCINISTRRIGNGNAYLEYTTQADIKRIDFDISWWSNDERVSADNSTYKIEIFINDSYVTLVDLWNDIELSTDRNNPTHLNLFFPVDVNKFRFRGFSENPINDRNKGRLSIFDMLIEYR